MHEPLSEGDPILVVDGGQTGAHIDVSGLITGSSVDIVSVIATATRVSDGSVFAAMDEPAFLLLASYDAATGTGWFAGRRTFSDVEGVPLCEAQGAEIDLCVRFEELPEGSSEVVEECVRGVISVEPAVASQC